MPELRLNRLREEWVAYASDRNERTFLPEDFCPLCPSGPGGDTEVPLADFEVVVFENRFPAFGPDRVDGRPVRPASTGCEVVVYTSEHTLTLTELPEERIRLLIDVWAERYRDLRSRAEVGYVYIFENKGVEMGVTLHHPHGQIYAMPFVPPVPALELRNADGYRQATGRCLHCDEAEREAAGPRRVFEEGSMLAFVPHAARWPYEVHVYPRRHAVSIEELDSDERWELSRALLRVARAYDRNFGFSTPYVMAVHQAPTGGDDHRNLAHLHFEFYPPHRRTDRLKYLAGVELGAGTWVNDTEPEQTALDLVRADQAEGEPA
jgi:UDPglucose--hexose-1-phosphate uridylyltransferase